MFNSEYRVKTLSAIKILKDIFNALEKFIPYFDQELFQIEYLVNTFLEDSTIDLTKISS